MQLFILVLELIGTVAFSVSGTIVAIRKKMDIFGVMILAVVTACGGGLIRDMILGELPPVLFRDSVYAGTASATALTMFIIVSIHRKENKKVSDRKTQVQHLVLDKLLLTADSLGLGVFTSLGVSSAINAGFANNMFFSVFLSVVTGVGGGLLRDIMSQEPPYIFVKHIYACASIIGAILCFLLWNVAGKNLSMIISCVTVLVIRLLSAHFHWNLPRIS